MEKIAIKIKEKYKNENGLCNVIIDTCLLACEYDTLIKYFQTEVSKESVKNKLGKSLTKQIENYK